MSRRGTRWLLSFIFILVNVVALKSTALAGDCLSAVNAPGCFEPEVENSFAARVKGPWTRLMRAPGAQEWMRLGGLR